MIVRLVILISFLVAAPNFVQAAKKTPSADHKIKINTAKAKKELHKIPTYREASQAMADHLPEIAVRKFKATIANKKLSANARAFATLALAEALIRSSVTEQGSDQDATTALELLSSPELADNPSTPIWKAEALAALGHYQKAETLLENIPTTNPYYSDVQLARARISIALKQNELALKILSKFLSNPKKVSAKNKNSAKLLKAEIYLNQGNYQEALKALDGIDPQFPSAAKLKEYLEARIALAEGKATDAITHFKSLITAPDHLSQRIFEGCMLGLADAFVANQQSDDAISTLTDYVTRHPNSPALPSIFLRLGTLIPADLPPENPIMLKLSEWSGKTDRTSNLLYVSGDSAAAIPPYQFTSNENRNLTSLTLYLRAQLLERSKNPEKYPQALALLSQLRTQNIDQMLPSTELFYYLASASLLDTANIQLKQKKAKQAAFSLEVMSKVAFSPRLKDQANFLLGLLKVKEADYEQALIAFNFARESTSQEIATASSINAGITALLSNNLSVFDKIFTSSPTPKVLTALRLEHALWKCRNQDISGRSDLDAFIMSHLGHPRENEARMALAAAAVDIQPTDITLAKAQLDLISPRLQDATNQYKITRIRIRAEELNQNWTQAAKVAAQFISKYPTSPHVPAIMIKQGEAYYHSEDFNAARRVFQEIISKFPDSTFAPYAQFYTAMAARLGGTIQAREESVQLFKKIIHSTHPLASEARIQQSRVLIDLRRYDEAVQTLKPLLQAKNISSAIRRDAGVLMADCLHRQAATDPEKYKEAVRIYDQILSDPTLPLAWINQIHFLRGQTLERMGKRKEAMESYYSVIAKAYAPEKKDHEIEWFWFYRCGFQALSMLEADQRWEAAVKLARRIATFDGPRAEEASKRANNLAKQHMIWED